MIASLPTTLHQRCLCNSHELERALASVTYTVQTLEIVELALSQTQLPRRTSAPIPAHVRVQFARRTIAYGVECVRSFDSNATTIVTNLKCTFELFVPIVKRIDWNTLASESARSTDVVYPASCCTPRAWPAAAVGDTVNCRPPPRRTFARFERVDTRSIALRVHPTPYTACVYMCV